MPVFAAAVITILNPGGRLSYYQLGDHVAKGSLLLHQIHGIVPIEFENKRHVSRAGVATKS